MMNWLVSLSNPKVVLRRDTCSELRIRDTGERRSEPVFVASRQPIRRLRDAAASGHDERMTSARPYHHGDLKETLIALATDFIAAHGVEDLSVRGLAREAGVAHRAAYQHFADKNALVAAVLARAYDRLSTQLEKPAVKPRTPQEKLVAVAEIYAAFALDEPNVFLAMTGPRVNEGGEHEALEAALRRAWRHVTEPIAALGAPDKRLAAALFWGGLQGVVTQTALGRLKLKPSERAAFFRAIGERLVAAIMA